MSASQRQPSASPPSDLDDNEFTNAMYKNLPHREQHRDIQRDRERDRDRGERVSDNSRDRDRERDRVQSSTSRQHSMTSLRGQKDKFAHLMMKHDAAAA